MQLQAQVCFWFLISFTLCFFLFLSLSVTLFLWLSLSLLLSLSLISFLSFPLSFLYLFLFLITKESHHRGAVVEWNVRGMLNWNGKRASLPQQNKKKSCSHRNNLNQCVIWTHREMDKNSGRKKKKRAKSRMQTVKSVLAQVRNYCPNAAL